MSEKKKYPYNTGKNIKGVFSKKIRNRMCGLSDLWTKTRIILIILLQYFFIIGNQLVLLYYQKFVPIFLVSQTKYWIKNIFSKNKVKLIDFTKKIHTEKKNTAVHQKEWVSAEKKNTAGKKNTAIRPKEWANGSSIYSREKKNTTPWERVI